MNSIHITIAPKGQLFAALLGDDLITTSRTPFLSSARVLLGRGHAPGTVLTMSREGETTIALRATIGAAAQLTVVENDDIGPKFGRYRAPPSDMTFAEVRGRAKTAGGSFPGRVAYEAPRAAL
ncbi:hypothetical protein [Bosea rubneri]|uniref:Uncharacterized protein n=1 Tax=Bosea rubneri TaxID=3075434 RepID=A0ABU3SDY5_9HYPH|nr:hypothetical protein [Bosea sp. ZW T0_25]MDU0342979.1 hypothetical protein [Bosea sp. ZW T0_25]